MKQLLLFRESLYGFLGKYEIYLKPLGKFLIALISFTLINTRTGYMAKADNMSLVLVLSLVCSFMPMGFVVFCAAALFVLHFYALSLGSAIVVLFAWLIIGLLYFRLSPKDSLVVILMPIFFFMKIPYVIPVVVGLVGTPASAASVACGTLAYYIPHFVVENSAVLSGMKKDDIIAGLRFVLDGLMGDKTLLVVAGVFAITVIIVYTLRRMAIAHSWTIAILVGVTMQMIFLLVGDLLMEIKISIPGILLGSLLSVVVAKVVEFLVFNVDYSRTEVVQFEDDDYYYYVKAVPKVSMAKPDKTVKKINTVNKRKEKS